MTNEERKKKIFIRIHIYMCIYATRIDSRERERVGNVTRVPGLILRAHDNEIVIKLYSVKCAPENMCARERERGMGLRSIDNDDDGDYILLYCAFNLKNVPTLGR